MSRQFHDEARVRELPAGSDLVLGPGDVATPAALDLAFARGIRVRWASDGMAGTAERATGGDGLWRRILAADGTYVVEVKRGRPRVVRLTDGGPVPVGLAGPIGKGPE